MKKFAISTLLLLTAAGTTQAQLRNRSLVALGVKAGGSAATYINDESRGARFLYGGHGGLFVRIPLQPPFYVQPELLYSMKGSTTEERFDGTALTLRTAYLDLAVPFRVSGGGLFAELGPQVGYLLSGSYDNGDGSGTTSTKELFRKVDVGYLIGAGYQSFNGGLGFGVRFNGGFLSALKPDVYLPGVYPFTNVVRNGVVQLYVTYSKDRSQRPTKK